MRLAPACCALVIAATQAAASDFPLRHGTYLSTAPAQAVGVAIADGGLIVVAGNDAPGSAFPGGSGRLRFIDLEAGLEVQSLPLTGTLRAFATDAADGRWIAGGDFGVVLSEASGAAAGPAFAAAAIGGVPARVALCGPYWARLAGTQAALYDRSGVLQGQFSVAATRVADLACSADGSRIYVGGDRQVNANLRVAYVEAYDPSGAMHWRAWGWSASELQPSGSTADTDVRRLRLGRDGRLHIAARTDGGNNLFRYRPQDLTQNAPNVGFDAYNQTFQLSGAPSLGYYARLDPASGAQQAGQYLLTRLSNGNGNSVGTDGLDVDESGRLHLVGQAFASLATRDTLSIAGNPVGPYSGGDPYLLVAPSSYQSREYWHPFGAANGRGVARAVATRGGVHAFVVDLSQGAMQLGNPIINDAQLGFTPGSATPAAWLGAWGQPPALHRDGFEAR